MQQDHPKATSTKKRLTKIGPYILLKQIGKGSYSVVYQAYKQGFDGQKRYAVKKINLDNVDKKQLQRIHLELNVLSVIKHKNIVQLIDSKQTSRNLYLIFQYCKFTDLQSHIKNYCNGSLPQEQVKKIMIQLKNAFVKLRQYKIVHRDLKLSNILVTEDFGIKIADFGFAKSLSQDEFLQSCVGTLMTMAPQVLDRKTYNEKCDIWSLGIIIYQMFYGMNPFLKNAKMSRKQIKTSLKGELCFPSPISDSAKDLISKMLIRDSTKRCSFQQFFQHPWFKDQTEWQDNLDQILLQETLKVELKNNLSNLPKTEEQKKLIMQYSCEILCYNVIEFVKNTIQNQLMFWVNLGKKIVDIHNQNERLNFLALAGIVDNINIILKDPIEIVINSRKIFKVENYPAIRKIQTWESSIFSRRLPNFLSKSQNNFQDYLRKLEPSVQHSPEQTIISSYLHQLIWQISNPQNKKQEMKPFAKFRPTDLGKIQVKLQSPILNDRTLNLLIKKLEIYKNVTQSQANLKKNNNIFKCTLVKRRSELDKLYEVMKLKLS